MYTSILLFTIFNHRRAWTIDKGYARFASKAHFAPLSPYIKYYLN